MNDAASQGQGTRPLSEWLQLMLGEIERKRQDLDAANAERLRRAAAPGAPPATPK